MLLAGHIPWKHAVTIAQESNSLSPQITNVHFLIKAALYDLYRELSSPAQICNSVYISLSIKSLVMNEIAHNRQDSLLN